MISNDEKAKLYDFRRPDKFSKEQIRTLSIMHETFARFSTASLSGLLRQHVQIHVESVDQLTLGEYIKSKPQLSTYGILNMFPLKGPAILEVDLDISNSILDRLLGGLGKSTASKNQRNFDDIDQSLMEYILLNLFPNLSKAWKMFLNLKPTLGQIETRSQFIEIVSPHEMIVLVGFNVKIGDTEGIIDIVLPYITIEPIIYKLNAKYFYSTLEKKAVTPNYNKKLKNLKVDSNIFCNTDKLSLHDISKLKKGSLIKIPELIEKKVFLESGNEIILELTMEKTGKDVTFTSTNQVVEDIKLEFLEPIEKLEKVNTAQTNPIMEKTLSNISNKIEDLITRQDKLADQFFFNSNGIEEELDKTPESMRPFSFIDSDNIEDVSRILNNSNPQLIAVILSYIDSGLSAKVLSEISSELQPEIIKRITTLDRMNPEVLSIVERCMEKKLSQIVKTEHLSSGGIDNTINILNMAPRSIERNIIDYLDKSDPQFSEEIKKRMFVFEDMVMLDPKSIVKVFKQADLTIAVKALKKVDKNIADHIYKALGKDISN